MTYDSNKFEFISVSAGAYKSSTNIFAYVNYEGMADRGSVTFTFKAKNTGTGSFNISELVLSSSSATIGTRSTSVTVNAASNTNTKPSTGNNKPTNNTNTNQNQNQGQTEEPEVVVKTELDEVLVALEGLIETDYTADSWNALKSAIEKAQNASTNAEYDEVKGLLTIDNLVIEAFEKDELMNMLIELMGKSQKDYTEDSWKELQEAIANAQTAKLKSEYDEIKGKLTIDTLKEKEGIKEFFENFIQGLERKDPFYLAFAGSVLVLLLIILILLIVVCKGRKDRRPETGARRMR